MFSRQRLWCRWFAYRHQPYRQASFFRKPGQHITVPPVIAFTAIDSDYVGSRPTLTQRPERGPTRRLHKSLGSSARGYRRLFQRSDLISLAKKMLGFNHQAIITR